MKLRIAVTLVALFLMSGHVMAQVLVTEASLSPDGNTLAFIINDGVRSELLAYDFRTEEIIRLTQSDATEPSLSLKSNINWIDDVNILFLSKHSGIFQQYIIDIDSMTLTRNGSSNGSEFNLVYSHERKGSYYTQFNADNQMVVFFRETGSDVAVPVCVSPTNLTFMKLSPNEKYLSIQVEPWMNLMLLSATTGETIKAKLPDQDAILWAWAPDGNRFLYSNVRFYGQNQSLSREYVYIYDIEKRKSTQVGTDKSNYMMGAVWEPCDGKLLYAEQGYGIVADSDGRAIKSFSAEGWPVCWLTDCRTVVFVNEGEIYTYDTDTEKMSRIY